MQRRTWVARIGDGGDLLKCSFCGKSQKQVKKLIAGPGVYICDECIDLCNEIIEEELAEPTEFKWDSLPKPREIYEFLDAYVIGQDKAKKALSVAVYNHYKRVQSGEDRPGDEGVELAKSNILLLGPTGSGKTLLAQTLARLLNVPFAIADATALTEAGYVGEDVENILLKLIQAADYDVKKAETGIIYIDEIDKIARKSENPSITRDQFGEVMPEDLLKFGMIPEFVGRLPVITSVHNLDREALIQILTEPRNALVKQYRRLFELDGVDLEFSPDSLEAIADQANLRGTGARGLRAIMEEVLQSVMYEVPSRKDVERVVITREAVLENVNPTIVPRDVTRRTPREKSA